MKKHFLLFALLSGFCFNGFATMQTVTVNSNFFAPPTFNILLGDTVKWVWVSGQHTTTSTTIPAGANNWNQNMNSGSTTFIYVPNKVGTYNYHCNFHTSMIASFVVGCPTPVVSITNPVPIVVCSGTTVLLNSSASGGAPFTYQWQTSTSGGSSWSNLNGATNSNYNAAGSSGISIQYRVIVTNSCQNTGVSQAASVSIQTIAIGVTPLQNTVCLSGCVNLVAASTNGGTISGNYFWSPSTGLSVSTGATPVACPTSSTTYTVTFISSIGCTGTANTFVGVTPPPTVIGIANAYTVCAGTSVQLNATSIGGVTYSWSPAAGLSNPNIPNPIAVLTGNTTYTVTASTTNGCTGSDTVAIHVGAGFQLSQTHVNSTCGSANGSIDLTVIGSGAFTYHWNTGATTQDITNIGAGGYSVTVSSGAGCTNVLTVSVTNIGGPTLSAISTDVMCNGNATGSINISVNGGTAPYTFLWSNGATTQNINNLIAGNYTITVTDNINCHSSLTTTIFQPSPIVLSQTHIDASCGNANGSINLTALGGETPFSYNWSNGAITQDINNLSAGTYIVTVTDFNGCTSAIYAIIANSGNISLAETHINASCGNANGSINLSVTNGIAPFIYHWSNNATTEDLTGLAAGTYTITVTSTVGCSGTLSVTITNTNAPVLTQTHTNATCGNANGGINLTVSPTGNYNYFWSNGATTEDLTGLLAGTYTVTVYSPGIGCVSTLSVTITNASGTLTQTHVNASCGNANGSINLTVSPNGNYNYLWSNGATTQDINNLLAGTYTVTVSNSTGCSNSLAVIVTGTSAPVIIATAGNASCGASNGYVVTSVTGGTGPYSYVWNNGTTTSILQSVPSGVYSVTVYDANQCSGTYTITVGNSTTAPQVSIQSGTATFCAGGNAVLVVAPLGNSYQWTKNNVNIAGATNITYTATVTGTFSCLVTYPLPCGTIASNGIAITKLATPTATITANGPTTFCAGQSVMLNVNIQAGVTYQWRKNSVNIAGATNSSYTATVAGSYRCIVTKTATGCYKLSNNITVVVNCKLEELNASNIFNYYPNPFNTTLTVQLNAVSTIAVYNVLGQKLIEIKDAKGAVNIGEELNAGMYILEVRVNNEAVSSQRIVKVE